jgi:protein gp37
MGQPNYARGFQVVIHERMLELPLTWKAPRMIFVNSMSDLFHEDVPASFVQRVFQVMGEAHWHTYQILTKRSRRLRELDAALEWPPNVWMGVTVEKADYLRRVDDLRRTHAAVRFLSLEPLLGPMSELDLDGIDWVVVGGESGPGSRPMREQWVLDVRDKCVAANVPFFFKQWGGVHKRRAGRFLEGRVWSQFPRAVPAGGSLGTSRSRPLEAVQRA